MKIKKIIKSRNIYLVSIVALIFSGLFLMLKNKNLSELSSNISYFLIAAGTIMYGIEIRSEKN